MYYSQYPYFQDPRGGMGFPGGGPGGFPGGGPSGPPPGFPGGGPGGFPGGGPGGFPGGGHGGGPGGGPGGHGAPPSSPPPSFVPQMTQTFAVDPGGIRRCLFRNTYVWLENGRSFWYYPTFVGRTSIAGWRWSRRFGWYFFGISLRDIRSFQCF